MRKNVTPKEDWQHKESWLQQNNLTYAGLIGIGVVIVQSFITAPSLDLPSTICVVAFSLAIPLLAVLLMLNQLQSQRHYTASSPYISIAKTIGLLGACVGVVAALWHMLWIAGVMVMVSGIMGLAIYTGYYKRLEQDEALKAGEQERLLSESDKQQV
ncbi:hypothetical protein [Ktedonospora formicarum]|uniref:Uncharacterized protein n=1 Tax=Ktedonospora formicarum TaxID=2778364 RepID=A0A8J3I0Z7_9CHLR|nr:hypothetical protein [Ktedonospora formicarum]GHO45586.1 hypothetical protein KSX_37490 [Ktedonospora formicarum]